MAKKKAKKKVAKKKAKATSMNDLKIALDQLTQHLNQFPYQGAGARPAKVTISVSLSPYNLSRKITIYVGGKDTRKIPEEQ